MRPLRRLASLLAALAALPPLWTAVGARAASVPYNDPSALGHIGFCDRNGNPVDHGSITDKPFIWLAVSSSPTPAAWANYGKTATFLAAQPIQGTLPAYWNTQELAATSFYTNAVHPMVAATADGSSLKDFVAAFPIKWDGFVQLRMIFAAPGQGAETTTYPATDIQISGDTWTVVRGGNVDCHAGYAISTMDTAIAPASTATVSPAAPVSAATGAASQPSSGSKSPTAGAAKASSSTAATTSAGSASPSPGPIGTGAGPGSSSGGGAVTLVVAIGAAIVILLAAGLLLRKRLTKRGAEPVGEVADGGG